MLSCTDLYILHIFELFLESLHWYSLVFLTMSSSDFACKRTPSQKDFRSKAFQALHIFHISPNIPHSTDSAEEGNNVEFKVWKRVDAFSFVREEGERFLVGERTDGRPGYRRLWNRWERLRRALRLSIITMIMIMI